ncbi:MAG: ribonuclease R [Desulfovibrionaceae bacterium CG1_02_65_16]|nr:MAG: ribonuclease R [Desulfovibrionaceae bacterium CG1_02_65_16]
MKLKKKRNPSSPPPVAEPAALLRLLKESKRPLSPDELLPVLGLHRRKRGMVDEMLHGLETQGKLIRLGRAYALAERVRLVRGKVQLQRSGAAFLIPDEPGVKDVFLGQDIAGAWHGDHVSVAITRAAGGRTGSRNAEGRVVEILERGRQVLSVRIMRPAGRDVGENAWLCRPTDPRLDFAVLARDVDPALGLQKGDIALATPGEQVDSTLWEGKILSRLGPETLAQVQEMLTKANHGVPTDFPADALAEAEKLPAAPAEADLRGREDLRATPFVTIDGATARDFDDAVFVARKGQGYELWVAIADVAHYVPLGSALDREAYERGNSYYFPSSVEPMFPQALSNGLCSLNPRVPRLSMAVRMKIGPDGTRGEARVMNAVIQSHARLTYSSARDVCVDKLPAARDELAKEAGADVVDMLDTAEELARKMRTLRIARGSLDFDMPEGEVVFDPAGQPVSVRPTVRHFAHQLIEEFMIAANEAVSEYLSAHALPCLYRVHAEPDQEKLENLYTLLARLDGEKAFKRKNPTRFTEDDFTPEALGRLLASVAGTPREFLVHRLVLRSMKQARYQPENEGHYGLASESYAHFTSPIRRYADLVVHRLIKVALGDKDLPVPGFKRLAEIGQHLSARERVAMEAERECQKRYVCMVLKPKIGEVFAGVVSGISEYGFWVELPEVLAEGFIRLANMQDDYYGYVKEREMLVGSRTGKVYRLGQAMRVRLTDVSLDRLEIDLEVAASAGDDDTPLADSDERRDARDADQARRPNGEGRRRPSARGDGGRGREPGRRSGRGRGSGKPTGKPAGKASGAPKSGTGGRPAGPAGIPQGKPASRGSGRRRER